MLELALAAGGHAVSAVFEFLVSLLPGGPEAKARRAIRRRVREASRTRDWAAIERAFDEAMLAGYESRLPSTVLDAIPKTAAPHVASLVARGLRAGDPLTLMPATRIAAHTRSPEVHRELTILRDSSDPRLNAIADYALRRWPKDHPVTS